MAFEILVILALALANGFFAGAEIAIIAVRKSRLKQLTEERRLGARAVTTLREQPERFLATVQIGVTVVGATAAAFGGATMTGDISAWLSAVPVIAPHAHDIALALVIALVSFLSIVLGELVPKSLALRSGERLALWVGRPLLSLSWLMRPLVWLLTKASNAILLPFRDKTTFTEARLSAEEVQQIVEEAASTGSLDKGAGEIASRAIDFGALSASDVMVPRNRVEGIPHDASTEQIRRLLLEQGHSRMPVYQGTLDRIVGYIAAKDLLSLALEGHLIVLEDVLRPAYFVPETMGAVQVLREMQERRLPLAIVVDEHGGVSGLITIEDLIEELVGELFSEHDQPAALVVRQADGSSLVRGEVPIRDVNRELDLDLPEGEGWTTLAGLSMSLCRGIPQRGARLQAGPVTLEVVDATPTVVRLVRITPPGNLARQPPPEHTPEHDHERGQRQDRPSSALDALPSAVGL
jgi:putative hemolysin